MNDKSLSGETVSDKTSPKKTSLKKTSPKKILPEKTLPEKTLAEKTSLEKKERCDWAGELPIYQIYHDTEWGVPVWDDKILFEFVLLEGAQAGLSWITVLKKRENYRRAFDGFDVKKIAAFDERKIEALLQDPGIIRNRLKVNAAVSNAKRFMEIQSEFGSFADYVWQFVGGEPIVNSWVSMDEVPATTAESDALSKDLVKRGFKFMGSTICYAHMQATGLVNDHITSCFRYRELC